MRMVCKAPRVLGPLVTGCGQCTPCRVRKRREWTHRILLESFEHVSSSFVTLTYSDKYLPADGSVDPEHLKQFVKRLRYYYEERDWPKLRFFGVGEYGEKTYRPHYHLILFSGKPCEKPLLKKESKPCDCEPCSVIQKAWQHKGHILNGTVTAQSAEYTAKYTSKSMAKLRAVGNKHPEFMRCSNRPGIGLPAMWTIASGILRHNLEERIVDVPITLRQGRRRMPLGRYLRKKLRVMIGRDEKTPPEALEELQEKLRKVREDSFNSSPFVSVGELILDYNIGELNRVDAYEKRKKKGTL